MCLPYMYKDINILQNSHPCSDMHTCTHTHTHIHAHFIVYLREHVLYLAQKRFLEKWLTLSCLLAHSIACALNDMQCCTHTVWSWLYHELVFCEPMSVYNHFYLTVCSGGACTICMFKYAYFQWCEVTGNFSIFRFLLVAILSW